MTSSPQVATIVSFAAGRTIRCSPDVETALDRATLSDNQDHHLHRYADNCCVVRRAGGRFELLSRDDQPLYVARVENLPGTLRVEIQALVRRPPAQAAISSVGHAAHAVADVILTPSEPVLDLYNGQWLVSRRGGDGSWWCVLVLIYGQPHRLGHQVPGDASDGTVGATVDPPQLDAQFLQLAEPAGLGYRKPRNAAHEHDVEDYLGTPDMPFDARLVARGTAVQDVLSSQEIRLWRRRIRLAYRHEELLRGTRGAQSRQHADVDSAFRWGSVSEVERYVKRKIWKHEKYTTPQDLLRYLLDNEVLVLADVAKAHAVIAELRNNPGGTGYVHKG